MVSSSKMTDELATYARDADRTTGCFCDLSVSNRHNLQILLSYRHFSTESVVCGRLEAWTPSSSRSHPRRWGLLQEGGSMLTFIVAVMAITALVNALKGL